MSELTRLVRADVARAREKFGSSIYVIHPGTVAVLLYRLAHALKGRGPVGGLGSRALSLVNIVLTGADIHADACIGPGLYIPHASGVVVGAGTRAGTNLSLYGSVLLGQGRDHGFPLIGDDVTFWGKASAIGPVRIGDGVHVGAHALVLKDVPAGHNAVGVPALARPQAIEAEVKP